MGLDGLGSSSYGPEAALAVMIPLGGASLAYIGWVMAPIIALLMILFASYWQTISGLSQQWRRLHCRQAEPRHEGGLVRCCFSASPYSGLEPGARSTRLYWSGRRESNPRMQLGKLPFYH